MRFNRHSGQLYKFSIQLSQLGRGGRDRVAVVQGINHVPDKIYELISLGLTRKTTDLHNAVKIVDKSVLLPIRSRQTDDP